MVSGGSILPQGPVAGQRVGQAGNAATPVVGGGYEMAGHTKKPSGWYKEDPSQPRKSFDMEVLRLLCDSLVKKQLVPLIAFWRVHPCVK
jgi:hypothetical protein